MYQQVAHCIAFFVHLPRAQPSEETLRKQYPSIFGGRLFRFVLNQPVEKEAIFVLAFSGE